jgi:hypothetical protein
MKFARISGNIALIALAACCLLTSLALCKPMDWGPVGHGQCAMFAPLNNLTAEEMTNMTPGELKETRLQALNNATANGYESLSKKGSDKGKMDMRGASPIMLLIDDLTVEDLGNMTINQIKALSDKKMAELDNMTLAEIKLLRDKKMQERNNLTLNQLDEENKNMRQMARILEGLGFGRHIKA